MAAPAKDSSGERDTRRTLDAFLLATLRASQENDHREPIPLADIAREVGISERFSEKIAAFLESEGLVDYDDQAIDMTVEGILRAEELLRGDREEKPTRSERSENGKSRAGER